MTTTRTRTGRVVRWVTDGGTRWAVIEPHLTAAETETAADAVIASLAPEDRRAIESERLAWALARVRARRTRKRLTGQMVKPERPSQVFHRGDWCSVGGCEDCDERVRA